MGPCSGNHVMPGRACVYLACMDRWFLIRLRVGFFHDDSFFDL